MVNIEIGKNEQKQRLDKFLRKYLGNASLSYIYKAIRKDVKVNGRRAKEDTMLELGDVITLYISDEELSALTRTRRSTRVKRQFKVAYEDDNIIVVEKPFGLLTHGDRTEKKNHLANQVVDYLIEKGDYNPRLERTFTPASVNRLDRNTTGLVLFGKTGEALQTLNRMIREKDKVNKYYMTIVKGRVKGELHLRDRMVKDERTNKVRVLSMDEEGRDMETIVRPIETGRDFTLVEVELITGRTHQIRAHLAKAGHPVIGDVKYGDRKVNEMVRRRFNLNTQLLHAYKLTFRGCTGALEYLNDLEITADLPEDFANIRRELF
ncbi:MAG: RluA family pseudouridine synthase [Firmicutes bacterium]|nr:RluA family pseudouridine synthase [Bacillota bacterium]